MSAIWPGKNTPDRVQDTPRSPVVEGRVISHTPHTHVLRARVVNKTLPTARHYTRHAGAWGGMLILRSPIGVWRLTCRSLAWVSDQEGRATRRASSGLAGGIEGINGGAYVAVGNAHRDEIRLRLKITGITLAGVGVALLLAWLFLPLWVLLGVGGLALLALGWVGRPLNGAPMVQAMTYADGAAPHIDGRLIVDALTSLGIAELNKAAREDERAVRLTAPVHRDGAGWRADVELPAGVTAGDVIEKRERLASGLRRPLGTVWPEAVEAGHAGQLVVWVGDRPMAETGAAPWPLQKAGRVDLFEPFPFGTDQRGRAVPVTLAYTSGVVGAVPRMGKTAGLRLLLLGAALDPRCEIHAADLKGGADLLPLGAVAHYLHSGDDDEQLAALLTDLRAVQADMRRRYTTLRNLPREVAPDAKTTSELASRRELGLWPVVIGVDECQVAFEHKDLGNDFEEVITDLVKRGPAVGIIVLLATQRPDAKSLPSGIRANAVLRFCLKVDGQLENDMVLGTSAYKNGVRATTFGFGDKGVGYLRGEGAAPVITQTHYVDTPTADKITARARADRDRAGLLTGAAAGEVPDAEEEVESVLDHVLAVWPATDRERLHLVTLTDRLTAGGHTYTVESLGAALRAHDVELRQVKAEGVNRTGTARTDVIDAATARALGG